MADLRIRNGRLRLDIEGSGPIKKAIVNGKTMMPGADGTLRLSPDSMSGTVLIKTK